MLPTNNVYEDVDKCNLLIEGALYPDQDYLVVSEEIEVKPTLLDKARNGDSRAFEELIKPLITKFKWRAAKAVGDASADDVVQEACIKAFTKLHTFREQARFSSWFYAIGTNTIRMHLRTRRRANSKETLLGNDITVEDLISDQRVSYSFENQIIGREALKIALDALTSLPDGYKTALWSSVIEGMDLSSIANKMCLTPSAVKTRIHRARASLKELTAA